MPDVVVVGAGVTGSSIAFHLAERGTSVTVVDARRAGEGMSARSSALVRMHYSFPLEVRLAVVSFDYFRSWPERVGRPPVFRRTGFVRIVRPDEADLLRRNVEMQRGCGALAEVVGPDRLAELEPSWRVDDVVAAAYEPESGFGDGAAVAGDLLSRAREMGADYLPGRTVRALSVRGGAARAVVTDEGEIGGDVIVLATGVWTVPLLASAGVPVPIETEYHEVALLREPPGGPPVRTACIDSGTGTYFRPDAAGTLVGDFFGARGVDPDHLPERPGEESLAALVGRSAERVPPLADAGFAGGVTGAYDMTPDARPLIGPLPELDGVVLVAGFSGMGFKISPAVGLAVSELVLDGAASTVDLTPFHPRRFAEGRPIRAEFEYRDD